MLEVFTTGGGEYIVNTFNAVAAWSGGGGYKALIRVVLVMGLMYATLSMAWNLDHRVLWKWFVQATGFYLVLMVPTTSVKVTDRINPGLAPAVVANVPLGLGVMASFTSQVGDWLTQTAETVFVMPGVLQYSTGGIVYGARLMDVVQNRTLHEPVAATNLNEYMKSCLFYDILIHHKPIANLMASPNLLADIGPGSVSLSMSMRDAAGNETIVPCNLGYVQVAAQVTAAYALSHTKIAQETYPGLPAGAAVSKYDTDVAAMGAAGLGGGLTSAQQLTQQAMLLDALLKARASFGDSSAQSQVDAFAQARADVQTRETYATIAGQAMKWVPLLNIVLTVVFYALFPILFLLMLLPNGGIAVAKGYLTGFFYLASWGPLFVILNMIFMSRWQSALVPLQMGGLTASNFNSIASVTGDTAALAGYMIMSVPFLAAGMARGAMAIAGQATSFLAPSQHAAEQAATEATTGNYSYGAVGLANRTINTDTIDQHRTAPYTFEGAGYSDVRQADGRTYGFTADGHRVVKSGDAISSPGFDVSTNDLYSRDVRQALSEGRGVVEAKREAASQSWGASAGFAEQAFTTAQHSISSGRETGHGVTDSFNRMSSTVESASRKLQNTFGFDQASAQQIARDSIMSGRFNAGIGGPGGGQYKLQTPAKLGLDADAATNARLFTSEDLRTNKGFQDMRDWMNQFSNSDDVRSARDSFMRETSGSTDSQLRGATSRLESSLNESRGFTRSADRAEEAYNRLTSEWSQSESSGVRSSRNLNQEAVQFMFEEMDKNPLYSSTGFVPGMPVMNAEQREVQGILMGKFMAHQRERIDEDLGALGMGPELRLQGPEATSADSVKAWGQGKMAEVRSAAPSVQVERDNREPDLSGYVQSRIDGQGHYVGEVGAAMRGENFGARTAGDNLRDFSGARNHASLGGTTPGLGRAMDALDVPGSVRSELEKGSAGGDFVGAFGGAANVAPPSFRRGPVSSGVRPGYAPGGPVDTTLPARGHGFTTHGRQASGANQVGTQAFVSELQGLGAEWAAAGHRPVSYGELSHAGGGFMPGHRGHQVGREVDIRPFRLDGRNARTTWSSPGYDRNTTREFIQMVKQRDPHATVLFNDPELIREGLTESWPNHDNHLHLRLGPKR